MIDAFVRFALVCCITVAILIIEKRFCLDEKQIDFLFRRLAELEKAHEMMYLELEKVRENGDNLH